jgi:hypothetical protein
VSQVRVKLTFPESEVRRPVLATLVRRFDVEPNIRRADVEEHRGWIVCELEGTRPRSSPPRMAAPGGHHGRPAGRPPGELRAGMALLGPPAGARPATGRPARPRPGGDLPPGLGDLAGLVEDAAVGAGERERLVGVHLAALQAVAPGRGPHHVVAAILVDGHGPFWPHRAGRGSVISRGSQCPPQDPAALEREPLGHRPHRAGLHREPLRARALRGDPQGGGGHPVRGRRGAHRTATPPTTWSRNGWTPWARASRATSPQGGRGRRRGQRQGGAAAHSAGGLGDLALPDRAGATSGTPPPRSWSKRWRRRPASRWSRCA